MSGLPTIRLLSKIAFGSEMQGAYEAQNRSVLDVDEDPGSGATTQFTAKVEFGKKSIAKHAKDHGIKPLKHFGQNFLFDASLCDKIARTANIESDDLVVEIGPGTAGLTRSLLKLNPRKLIVIERDKRCISLLSEIKDIYPQLIIINADALKITIKDLITELKDDLELGENPKVKIVANLPYNIATPLILNWFRELENIESINVMVQKEVAERITASSGNKNYGRLSVICQLLTETKKIFDVSPESFYPRPKIWSSIVSFIPKKDRPNPGEIELVEKITRAAFGMRRKMLKSSLKSIVPADIIEKRVNATVRAENLTPLDYLTLASQISLLKDPEL